MGLTEERVSGPEDVLSLMARASDRRKVGETKMNKQSSRSHCVFTMSVRTRKALPDGSHMECAGKLHMVDLAGSECAKSAGGSLGSDLDVSRERERKNINQSLLTLGRVITLLKNGGKAKGERIPVAGGLVYVRCRLIHHGLFHIGKAGLPDLLRRFDAGMLPARRRSALLHGDGKLLHDGCVCFWLHDPDGLS